MPQESLAETGASPRRPGRPRVEEIHQRVLDAVVDLIDEEIPITVNAVVQRSGVSRAAIYRRWETLAKLTAEALDRGRHVVTLPDDLPVSEALAYGYPKHTSEVYTDYPEGRLRQRLRLGLADTDLLREYWQGHVSRRRTPIRHALERGGARGEVRTDADLEAALDLMSGVFYYQLVARGESLSDPEALARCHAALDIVWRGIRASAGSSQPGQI